MRRNADLDARLGGAGRLRGVILGPDDLVGTGVFEEASSQYAGDSQPPADCWDGLVLLHALAEVESEFAKMAASIDLINVFPVADGDTGANMLATIRAAVRSPTTAGCGGEPNSSPVSAKSVLDAAAEGAIDGARGNSGVILSQFFAGLASMPLARSKLDAVTLSHGLNAAASAARAAVAMPVEGTILTVMEEVATATSEVAVGGLTIREALDAACIAAVDALTRTPDQLDLLASAGVIDAGGYGFLVVLEALRGFAQRREGDSPSPISLIPAPEEEFIGRTATLFHDGVTMYCFNFMLGGKRLTARKIRKRLDSVADSLVVVEAAGRFRVHLHSPEVEGVVEEAQTLGSVSRLQIEEIIEQVTYGQAADGHQTLTAAPSSYRNNRSIFVVACASGDGLERVLRVMGATIVLRPDLPDFDERARSIIATLASSGSDIILLPNDAALIEPFRKLVEASGSTVLHLIETRTVPQGLTALAARRPTEETSESVALMRAASLNVKTLVVTSSVNTHIGDSAAPGGEFLGLVDGDKVRRGNDPAAVLIDLLLAVDPEDWELITIFSGVGVAIEMLERVGRDVSEWFPWLSLELIEGGQANEAFIVALE